MEVRFKKQSKVEEAFMYYWIWIHESNNEVLLKRILDIVKTMNEREREYFNNRIKPFKLNIDI